MKSCFKIVVLFLLFNFNSVFSQNINVVRDAEIESFMKDLAKPILDLVEVDSGSVKFYLDNQTYINAFVVPGPSIFLTKELLTKTKNIDEVASVIAHEIGHVTGGHFNKIKEAAKGSSITTILSTILAAGAFALGAPDAGTAVIMGGQHISSRQMLSFSRNQESFADQAAIKTLKLAGYDLYGMYTMFNLLSKRERLSKFNPYNQTHPLSSERKRIIQLHLSSVDTDENLQKNSLDKINLEHRFKLVQAKLIGYFENKETFDMYYPNPSSLAELYGQTFQLLKTGNITRALENINSCIKIEPFNPYFYELKGQIYHENGMITEAIKNFEKAIEILKNENSFKLSLSKSLYLQGGTNEITKAINFLEEYRKKEEFPIEALHYLGLSYGKIGRYSLSSLALTEKFLLLNDIKNAKVHLVKAKKLIKKNTKEHAMYKDLLNLLKQKEKELK